MNFLLGPGAFAISFREGTAIYSKCSNTLDGKEKNFLEHQSMCFLLILNINVYLFCYSIFTRKKCVCFFVVVHDVQKVWYWMLELILVYQPYPYPKQEPTMPMLSGTAKINHRGPMARHKNIGIFKHKSHCCRVPISGEGVQGGG